MLAPSGPGIVTFDFGAFIAAYPEFSTMSQAQAQNYFNQAAGLYLDNTPCSPVCDLNQRAILLDLLTAHLATLFAAIGGQPAPALVGRISSATQGSVSVQTEYSAATGDLQAWLNQTKYGAAYYAATIRFRMGAYVPPPIPVGFSGRAGVFGLLPGIVPGVFGRA